MARQLSYVVTAPRLNECVINETVLINNNDIQGKVYILQKRNKCSFMRAYYCDMKILAKYLSNVQHSNKNARPTLN